MDSTPGALSMIRPLTGLSVVEFEGIGPGPLAGRMLADLGAEVVAVIRPNKAAIGDRERPLSDEPLRMRLCSRSSALRMSIRKGNTTGQLGRR
jgi:crotonobetainyl-CoA:carnitine CoA-transferase CaiB-like acyl-CoA transferase